MGKIFKNFVPYWKSVLMIILLLVIQAYCDLALPQYTSDIIDTGIQNCGVSHILPEKMTSVEYGYAALFMNDGELKEFESCYKKDGALYTRTENREKELARLDKELIIPVMIDYTMSSLPIDTFADMVNEGGQAQKLGKSEEDIKAFAKAAGVELKVFERTDSYSEEEVVYKCVDARPLFQKLVESGALDKSAVTASREIIQKQLDAMGSDTMKSSAVAFAVNCDREAGVDVDSIQTTYLWISGLKMLLVALILTTAAVLAGLFASKVGAGVGMTLRGRVFRNVIGFSNTEIDKFSTASLITRSTNDIQQIQMVSVVLLRMVLYAPIIGVGGVIKVLGTGAGMWWVIALAVAVIMAIVALLVGVSMPKFKLMQRLIDRVNLVSREILTGIPVIRAFGREDREEERFDEANTALTKTILFTSRVMTFMFPVMTVVMNLVSVLIVWVASGHINDGNMQVGEMTAFITYAMQIIISFLMLTMMSIMLPRAAVAAGRIDEVINTESSIKDKPDGKKLSKGKGLVEFKNVSFRYPGAEEDVLTDISFTARPGETTAVIGSTGSGKSTLINLIPRLYDVTDGAVLVDGEDIRDVTMESLREEIGYVPQKAILFSGTIASNLRFGNKDAADSELEKAAEIAQATEFIDSKDKRFDSDIAQGGSNVSGGQKQRLSIARAIAKNPKIYIFDDSFSALDMKTDRQLRSALEKEVGDSTVIIVAQRISTIMDAEQIIVLDEGRIAGIGRHSDLLKNCAAYLEIAKSQLSEKELGLGEGGDING